VVFGPIIYSYFYSEFIGVPNINYQSGYERLLDINDKSNSDRALSNLHYIDYLIEKIGVGEYDAELLSDSEREQVAVRLQKTKQ
jgi:hypothetical protein